MRRAYILLLVFLLGFGCIEDKVFPSERIETLLTGESEDLDNDGIDDYAVYLFTSITKGDNGMRIQRQISVTTSTSGTYTAVDPNVTDIDLLLADESLDEFSDSRTQSDSACSKNIGLLNVVCSDIVTCSKLCSSAGGKCKEIAAAHEEVLAGSMISYVQDNNELRSLVIDARRIVVNLGEGATDAERNVFLDKTRDIVAKVASINSNPLYTHSKFKLCDHSDFGLSYVTEAAEKIGEYETYPDSYHYRILFTIESEDTGEDEFGVEVVGAGITDRIPKAVLSSVNEVSSIQDYAGSDEAANVVVKWEAVNPSEKGYVFSYEFESATPPETLMASLKTPEITLKTLDMRALVPTNIIFLAFGDILGNYYVALGIALGATLAGLLVIYNIIILIIVLLSERAAGSTFTTGFRKAFGRTDVKWKSDLVIAALFLAAGFYVSTFVAAQPAAIPGLLESVTFLLRSGFGILGAGMILIGVVMLYLAAENEAKIIVLERVYGMVIRQERDMYIAKAATLKEKLEELETVIKKFAEEEFEVGKEYDILTSVKGMDIDKLTTKISAQTKTIIDNRLNAVESAISNLQQRKKLADENWPKWRDSITKILEEQNEVYETSLITVPASLKSWALNRYLKENAESVVLEHGGLKKKKVSADLAIQAMVTKGYLQAAIVIKGDAIDAAHFAEGTGTVAKALALRLRAYMRSLAKKLGQHAPQSFVAIGTKEVLVYMKGRTIESVLFVRKDKFNEAIDLWKSKAKVLEAGG